MKLAHGIILAAVSACTLAATICPAQIQTPGPSGQIFLDNFDNGDTAGSAPANFYAGGNVPAFGVTNTPGNSVSGNALSLDVDFSSSNPNAGSYESLNDTLGGTVIDLSAPGTAVSIAVKSSANPPPNAYFAFRVIDNKGDAYRSDPLVSPTSSFSTVSAPISSFIYNYAGDGTIDFSHIVEVDLEVYNQGDSLNTTLFFDDFQAVSPVPEPGTCAAGLLCFGSAMLVAYRKRSRIGCPA